MNRLPEKLRPLFWDCDFDHLSWPDNADFIIGRLLSSGDWEAVQWLRALAGDQALAKWFRKSRGRGLSPPRLRFWELILPLPHRLVNDWLKMEKRALWDQRHQV